MRDPLKEYIDQHRPEMDVAEPSAEVWNKIETTMSLATATTATTIAAKSAPWLKYFAFGASVITIAVVYSVTRPKYNAAPPDNQPKENMAPAVTTNQTEEKNTPLVAAADPATTALAPAQLLNDIPPAAPQTEQETAPSQNQETPPANNSSAPPADQKQSYQSSGTMLSIDTVFQGITRLELNCTSLDATIKAHPGNELKITGNLNAESKNKKKDNSKYRIVYTRNDTVLQVNVTLTCEKKNWVCIDCSAEDSKLNFDVPEKLNLKVNNTYGNTSVSGLTGTEMEIHSSSGNVSADNIHSNPRLFATYGDITARNIYGNLYGRSSSGNATVTNVAGNVDVSTTYGDQKISQVKGNLKATGSSGNIDLRQVTGDANVTTTYGNITIDGYKGTPRFISSSGSITGENVELTGNATMTTTYGDIQMKLINPLDALSFELASTYGELVVDKNGQRIEKESRLSLQKGNILIKGTSSSGSQTYR